MLSRVAERIYWIGRHMERAENTARLVNVYTNLLLDSPRSMPLQWRLLVQLISAEECFNQNYSQADEPYVVKFLLVDERNPSSVLCSLAASRENARTTREIMPSEVWERINDLYLHVRDNVVRGVHRGGRHKFLQETILACQQLNGLLSATMSHDSAFNFVKLGRNLERADMTSRILDIGAASPLQRSYTAGKDDGQSHKLAYDNLVWMSVLRSLSAYQMYRQHVHNRVKGDAVVTFLLQDSFFPRSIKHCLTEAETCMQQLPRSDSALRCNARTLRHTRNADIAKLYAHGLHEFLDEIQLGLAETHKQITSTWFHFGPEMPGQSQIQG